MSSALSEAKKIRSLRTRKGRKTHKQFLAEGVRLLDEALRHKVLPQEVYYAPSVISQRGLNLINKFESNGIRVAKTTSRQLAYLGAVETSPGILAVINAPSVDPDKLYTDQPRTILLCENISDPGNMGTLLRSALAFGFDMAILSSNCTEPFSPKVVRASAGAVFGLPIVVTDNKTVLELSKRKHFSIIATASKGRDKISRVLPKLSRNKIILALGSEAEGLSADILTNAEYTVRIHHTRQVESLNAAVAGSILMRECYESRYRSNK